MAIQFSKSSFMYGCQCPKRLYLYKFKKGEADPFDEQAMARFTVGTSAGELAQGYFPGAYNAQQNDPYPWESTATRTAYFLKKEKVICEATFIHQEVLCAVDILVETPDGYEVYEVKSTNSAKLQHTQDAALQYFVLAGSGIRIKSFSIMHFNRDYVRRGEIQVRELFTTTDITKQCIELQPWVEANLAELKVVIKSKEEPNIAMGLQCENPYPCNFQGYCSRTSSFLPVEAKVLSNQVKIKDNQKLAGFLAGLQYPLYFFDFETVTYGVPEYDESRPYQQIPFQYSLHVLRSKDAELEHHEFLAETGEDPRLQLIEAMKRDIGPDGTLIAWYKTFEAGRIQEMARDFPKHHDFLVSLMDRIEDLMDPFKSGLIQSEAFGGSSSIKNVLPIMVPELSYSNLAIQEGNTASFLYGQLAQMPFEQAEQTRKDLLAYCRLDTLAMVKIWEGLHEF